MNFTFGSGERKYLIFKKKERICNALKIFCEQLKIPIEYLGKNLNFMYDGSKIKINDNRQLGEIFKKNSTIIVIDSINLIGA